MSAVMDHATLFDEFEVLIAPCNVGLGAFAVKRVRAGEVILPVDGPRYSFDEAMRLPGYGGDTIQIARDLYFDPQTPARFLNHSCEPNACIRDQEFVALRDISPGEEFRFDYSTTMDEGFWMIPCRCGEATCRGTIRDFKYLSPELRRKYLAREIVQPYIRERYLNILDVLSFKMNDLIADPQMDSEWIELYLSEDGPRRLEMKMSESARQLGLQESLVVTWTDHADIDSYFPLSIADRCGLRLRKFVRRVTARGIPFFVFLFEHVHGSAGRSRAI